MQVLKRAGAFNPSRLFGVTTLDVLRANTFAAEVLGLDPEAVSVPVIGGHAGGWTNGQSTRWGFHQLNLSLHACAKLIGHCKPTLFRPAGATILPVLSAASPPVQLPEERARALMARIQDAGTEVVKVGAGWRVGEPAGLLWAAAWAGWELAPALPVMPATASPALTPLRVSMPTLAAGQGRRRLGHAVHGRRRRSFCGLLPARHGR